MEMADCCLFVTLFHLEFVFCFVGFFLAVGDRFYCHPFQVMLNVAETLSEGCTMCLWVSTTHKRKSTVNPYSDAKHNAFVQRGKRHERKLKIETVSGHKQVSRSCKVMED